MLIVGEFDWQERLGATPEIIVIMATVPGTFTNNCHPISSYLRDQARLDAAINIE